MDVKFCVLKTDDDRYTVMREPMGREVVCERLPLAEAKQAMATYGNFPLSEVPPIEQGSGYWMARQAVGRLGDVL